MNKDQPHLGNIAIAFWVLMAVVGDLLSLIPFVGDFVGPIFWIALAIYLWKKGFGFLNPKRLAVEGADMIIKMIPVLQEIPVELLLGVVGVVAMIKIEEKTGLKITAAGISNAISPANVEGVRLPQTQTATSYGSNNSGPLNVDGVRSAANQAPQTSTGKTKNIDTDETLAA